jgi:hypothetical protein
MSKHSKGGAHASNEEAKNTGYEGHHRAPDPVFEVRSPAEQAAWIEQQRGGGKAT